MVKRLNTFLALLVCLTACLTWSGPLSAKEVFPIKPATVSAREKTTDGVLATLVPNPTCPAGNPPALKVTGLESINASIVEWQYEDPNSINWNPFPNSAKTDFIDPTMSPQEGRQYRAAYTVPAIGIQYSNTVTLQVYSPDQLVNITSPTTGICPSGSPSGTTAVLTANVILSNNSPNYQWFKNGAPIQGALSMTYTIPAGTNSNGDYYTVDANNVCARYGSSPYVVPNFDPVAIVTAPKSTTVACGTNAIFAVTASGTTPAYQWYSGAPSPATLIAGATGPNLTITNPIVAMSGTQYIAVVSNTCNSVFSNAGNASAILTVTPTITVTNPASVTVCAGSPAILTVSSNDNLATFQWFSGAPGSGTAIAGQTSATFSAPTTAAGSVNYYVVATSPCGMATSSAATVTVNANPIVALSPATPASVCAGSTVILTTSVTSGTGPFTYAWSDVSKNSTDAVTVSGTYTVTVTDANSCKGVSNSVAVTVNANPVVTITPAGATNICENSSSLFQATATGGGGTYTYQWYRNNTALQNNATGSGYTAAPPTGVYTYYVIVTDQNNCTATSPIATLTVNPKPGARINGVKNGTATGCSGAPLTLTASDALSTSPPAMYSYVWTPTNEFTASINATQTTVYSVSVTNGFGCSDVATENVTITPLTVITTQPVPSTTCEGGLGYFSVTATGTNLSYQWQTLIGGVWTNVGTAANYTTAVATYPGFNGRQYRVIISGDCGVVTSNTVTLTVNPNTVIASGPVAISVCSGATAAFNVTATGTGTLTYQWSKNGVAIPGATTAVYVTPATVDADNGATFSVAVTGACSVANGSVVLTVNKLPTASITGAASVCNNATASLTASGGIAYLWSTTATTATIPVNTTNAGSTTFAVTVTDANNCSAVATKTVTVNALPTASITGPTSICQNATASLTAGGNGTTFAWSNATSGATTTINTSATGTTTYTVTATDANGCVNTASQTVTVIPVPTLTLTPTGVTTFCQNSSVTFNLTSDAASYLWSTGSTANTITAVASGAYSVTATGANGCTSTASQVVTVLPLPDGAVTAAGSLTFCNGGSVALTATGGVSYKWNGTAGGATTATITATASGNYKVSITGQNGCVDTISRNVVANAAPTVTASAASATTFCAGGSVILNASSPTGTSFQWSYNGQALAGATSASYSASASGSYSVQTTDGNACASAASAAISINVLPLPDNTVKVNGSTTFCAGGTTTLTANGTGTYLWSTGATTQTITADPNNSAIYTVTVTGANSCKSTSDAIPVKVLFVSNPSITSATGSGLFCNNGSLTLTAAGADAGGSYKWFPNGETTATVTETSAGTYIVSVTNSVGCVSTAQFIATAQGAPVATIKPASSPNFCPGGSVVLNATGDPTGVIASTSFSYIWSNGAKTSTITTSATGSYTVTITNTSGCTSFATQAVVANTSPAIAITGPASFCAGSTFSLTASGGATYVWGGTDNTQTITKSAAGTYTVTATDANGCVGTKSVTVTSNALPSSAITASGTTTFCNGGSVALSAPTGLANYVWSNNTTTASTTVSTSGVYTVTVTDANGCQSSSSQTVTVNAGPVVAINGATTTCSGVATTLTASGGATYKWSSGETTATISKSAPAIYTVTASDVNGCSASASLTLSANSGPVTVINGPVLYCQGSNFTLTASGGATYKWSSGETTAAITQTAAGTYTVTATDINGCSSTASQIVTANPLPNAALTGPASFCNNTSFKLIASGGASYKWSSGETTPTITKTTAGTYTVTITAVGGCFATQSQTVVANAAPVVAVTGATGFCPGKSATFTATGGSTYSWSSGETTADVTKNVAGTYTVTVTAANGCSSTASQVITANPNPKVVITETKKVFCQGDTAALTASGGGTYLWDNTATTPTVTVKATGNYFVTVTSAAGCSTVASDSITVNPSPRAVPTSIAICASAAATTFTAPPGSIYRWSTGDTTASIAITASGAYSVTVTNVYGCVGVVTDTLKILGKPKAQFVFAAPNNKVTFGNNSTGSTKYQWFFGDPQASVSTQTSPIFVYPGIGTYTVKLVATNDAGCTDTLTQTVSIITGVQDIAAQLNVGVYPNPVSSLLTVEFRNALQTFAPTDELFIVNAIGSVIYAQKITASKTTISTADWANGMYLLNARINGKVVSFSKVVKND